MVTVTWIYPLPNDAIYALTSSREGLFSMCNLCSSIVHETSKTAHETFHASSLPPPPPLETSK